MNQRKRGRPKLSAAEKLKREVIKMKVPEMFTREWFKFLLERFVLGVWAFIVNTVSAVHTFVVKNWRESIAFIALVLLATSAAYGVFLFALLFVPPLFALIAAGAFEATYIGLGVARLVGDQRIHAQYISASAVAVSILYNTIVGVLHLLALTPAMIFAGMATATGMALFGLWVLVLFFALLHGVPLALTAYFLSDLILHKNDTQLDNGSTKEDIINRMISEGLSTEVIYKIVGGNRQNTLKLIARLRKED